METLLNVLEIIQNIIPPLAQLVRYIKDLEENVGTLKERGKELESKQTDIEREGEVGSRKGLMLTNEVGNWLKEVSEIRFEIYCLDEEFKRRRTISHGFFAECLSRYDLGRRVVQKLQDVEEKLNARVICDQILVTSPPPRVMEMPASPIKVSTHEKTFDEIWDQLHNHESGIICVYGMGGIGKTNLMKNIQKKLKSTQNFNYVIWVKMPKELNLEKIQKTIMKRLGMNFESGEDDESRCAQLYSVLEGMRYVLILDDLWQKFSLHEAGIPKPDKENRSKIVITTRQIGVCSNMDADVNIKVSTLTSNEAWNLFHENAKDVILLENIRPLAKEVVMECGGLPLAIVVVGRAMCGKEKVELWHNALRALKDSVPEIEGMEPDVFQALKLSYDYLKDDRIKKCFLYCSLFPEDYEIDTDELVRYWIMEGFIDDVDNLIDASNKGHGIIERIKDACLLDEEQEVDRSFVKMHDMIRDLALWITSSSSSNEGPKFLVRSGLGLNDPPREETWRDVDRISLMENKIAELAFRPNSFNLISLLMRENPFLIAVDTGFFELMPRLQVLDLSGTRIKTLTVTSSSLVNLRALILRRCRELREVPFLGQLKELQFLDLSHSGVTELPLDTGNLVKLKKLNISHLKDLTTIPSCVISRLFCLEELNALGTHVKWAKESEPEDVSKATLGEVGTLTQLTTLEISIGDTDCMAQDVFCQLFSTLRRFKISIGSLSASEYISQSEYASPCLEEMSEERGEEIEQKKPFWEDMSEEWGEESEQEEPCLEEMSEEWREESEQEEVSASKFAGMGVLELFADIEYMTQDLFNQQQPVLIEDTNSIDSTPAFEYISPCEKVVLIDGSNDHGQGVKSVLKHAEGLMVPTTMTQDLFNQQQPVLIEDTNSIDSTPAFEYISPCEKLVLIDGSNDHGQGVKSVLKHAEGLMLRCTHVNCVSDLAGDLKSLRKFLIRACNEMDCVLDWRDVEANALRNIDELGLLELPKLKNIFEGQLPHGSLSRLRKIDVHQCSKLKSLFSSQMVGQLCQVEVLDVRYCDKLEEIVDGDESLPDNPFPRLHTLDLVGLSELTSIVHCPTLALPSLKHFSECNCPKLRLPDCPSITKIKNGHLSEASH